MLKIRIESEYRTAIIISLVTALLMLLFYLGYITGHNNTLFFTKAFYENYMNTSCVCWNPIG